MVCVPRLKAENPLGADKSLTLTPIPTINKGQSLPRATELSTPGQITKTLNYLYGKWTKITVRGHSVGKGTTNIKRPKGQSR